MLDLINENETDKAKNLRHTKDLDSLEREIRKSPDGMDKDTQAHIDKKRKELAANKAKMQETTVAGGVAAVAMPLGAVQSRKPKKKNKATKESGLQRYTGIKKYGKKGFEELQKAGRNGASEEEKGAIKDKHLNKKR